uniref:ATP synthase F0 subunit 8 n=1 Tax=Pallaseopsis kessleri TaxID=686709 RepID=A0A1L5BW53_9CRUS|nr:ATP synthase F0 subunit 8 [Pallaseopsis kessleri]APL97198.1 ATP synthase F0 subunit 8 [Pallaseopsis kessleri]
MPQMAPALYLQLFILISLFMLLLNSNLYFTLNKPFTTTSVETGRLTTTWLW